MLTRLRVSGFKNLVDVDISFGPFTCIAGANGVGKSNLLDAIVFLSALSNGSLMDAALAVRDQGAKTGDLRGLFHHVGDHYEEEMSFVAEMIIPRSGEDDLGQPAQASSTFVRYSVSLRYKQDDGGRALGSLELTREELEHITLGDAASHLPFKHSRTWRNQAVINSRRTPKYISTEGAGPDRVIKVHQDGGSSGKPQRLRAANLPRTVVSAANSAESPTATLVKREMQSWRMLQLEPSSLREPDNFTAPTELATDGAHLPAAMFHLAHASNGSNADPDAVYTEIANRVSELIDDVRGVSVDRDERRQLLTVSVTARDGTIYPARALSDGTLRFLALAVLAIDPDSHGIVCMEEPENGIHPERIPAMIRLLQDLATDTRAEEAESETALRQVIVNTHSPAVVLQVRDDSLVMAESVEQVRDGKRFKALHFRCLGNTWRASQSMETIPKGQLLAYLNPVSRTEDDDQIENQHRVIDSGNLRQLRLDFVASEGAV